MFYEVSHTTRYLYSAPVFVEPQMLRLRPRCEASQQLHRYTIQTAPAAAGMTEGVDGWGNPATWAWFTGEHPELTIRTEFIVETRRPNPFDYIIPSPAQGRLPPAYGPEQGALELFLRPAEDHTAVRAFAEATAVEADGELIGFLTTLTGRIYGLCTTVFREEGAPLPASTTLTERQGSCRDLAMLFVECCRQAGVAARFVSGYQEGDPAQERREMHAWAEVYVPGGGWRGYDPTHGLVVADRHVALAAAADAAGAAPSSGTFRGTGATSSLQTRIQLRATEDPPS